MIKKYQTTEQFLENEVYLPGYMLLAGADYDKKGGVFTFNLREPLVLKETFPSYLTPRGLHICVSQASYALVENMIREEIIEDFDILNFRDIFLQGRVKITELYEKFRKEIGLSKIVQGRFDILQFRMGKFPILKLDFDFENKAIHGNLVSVIAPNPVPQTNSDMIRF